MRIESLVSGYILQNTSYLGVIFLFINSLQNRGAEEGGKAGSGASDGPLSLHVGSQHQPPTRGKRHAKSGQALQQSIQNISRAGLNIQCRAKGYDMYKSGEKLDPVREKETKCFLTSPATASQLVCVLKCEPPVHLGNDIFSLLGKDPYPLYPKLLHKASLC